MSRPGQIDLHPDAESLSAFVEHALPDGERDQLLSHLAVCPPCREVVFLAQEAAAEEEAPKPVAIAAKGGPRRAWLAGWRPVWGMAMACAAVLAISVPILWRHANQKQAMDRTAEMEMGAQPQPSAAQAPAEVQPATPPPPAAAAAAGKTESHSLPGPSKPVSAGGNSGKTSAPAVKAGRDVRPPASVSQTVMVAPPAVEASRPPLTETIPTEPTLSMNPPQMSPPVASGRSSGAVSGSGSGFRRFGGGAVGGAASRGAVAPRVTMAPRPGGMAMSNAPRAPVTSAVGGSSRMQAAGKAPANLTAAQRARGFSAEDATVASEAMQAKLPNGQTPAYTAAGAHHVLAIDATGVLFISDDAGKTWQPVAVQWSGRASALGVASVTSADAAGNAASDSSTNQTTDAAAAAPAASSVAIGGPVAPRAPAARFEIINDSGAIWVSVDGKTWTAKDLNPR